MIRFIFCIAFRSPSVRSTQQPRQMPFSCALSCSSFNVFVDERSNAKGRVRLPSSATGGSGESCASRGGSGNGCASLTAASTAAWSAGTLVPLTSFVDLTKPERSIVTSTQTSPALAETSGGIRRCARNCSTILRCHSFAEPDCDQQGVAKSSGSNRQASCNLLKRTITKPPTPRRALTSTSFEPAPSIPAVYPSGSRGRDDHRPNSDMDVRLSSSTNGPTRLGASRTRLVLPTGRLVASSVI
jgi:hypothetical protein